MRLERKNGTRKGEKMKKGIDISYWQGKVDFSKVSKSVEFVILREGYRMTIDKRFWNMCKVVKEIAFRFMEFIISVTQLPQLERKKKRLLVLQTCGKLGWEKM